VLQHCKNEQTLHVHHRDGVSERENSRYIYASYIIHHTPYTIHHTSYIIHHTSHSIHHTSYIIHHTSYLLLSLYRHWMVWTPEYHRHLWVPSNCTCTTWCMMYDVWCMMYDVWCMMYDVWCMMYDVRCMMYDVWCMMFDVGRVPSYSCAQCARVLQWEQVHRC